MPAPAKQAAQQFAGEVAGTVGALVVAGLTIEDDAVAGQNVSYHCQYCLSFSQLHVSEIHLSTAVLPQSSSSEVMPFSAKHLPQQSTVGVGVAE